MPSAEATLNAPDERRSAGGGDWTTIAVVAFVHGVSHFFQLTLVPLFPMIQAHFNLSFTELGLALTVFYVVSGFGQSAAGFVVDTLGARRVLVLSLALAGLAALGMAAAPSFWWICALAGIAGLGNCPFHPVDFSILNARISQQRLPIAYSIHSVCGNLGWAVAPLFMVGFAQLFGWRGALVAAAAVAGLSILLVLANWRQLDDSALRDRAQAQSQDNPNSDASLLGFLKLPAVWWSFIYFAVFAAALSGFQSFGSEASRKLHELPLAYATAFLTVFSIAGAVGMLVGGAYTKVDSSLDRIIMITFAVAAGLAVVMAQVRLEPMMFMVLLATIGFITGLAQTSRDLLIRRVAPPHATGRVYGFVYSGLDAGTAFAPLVFGGMLDANAPAAVWMGVAALQLLLVAVAWKMGRLGNVDAVPPRP